QTYLRPKERPLPEPGEPDEPLGDDEHSVDVSELWDVIRRLLPHQREQRLAYLLFHCGLKPREIVQFCADEFREVQEIYRLRRNIVERLVRNADLIRYWLNNEQLQA